MLVYDLAAIFGLKDSFDVHQAIITVVKSVQKQHGGKECGVYAIANATSVAFGNDHSKMAYQESVMLEQLRVLIECNDIKF